MIVVGIVYIRLFFFFFLKFYFQLTWSWQKVFYFLIKKIGWTKVYLNLKNTKPTCTNYDPINNEFGIRASDTSQKINQSWINDNPVMQTEFYVRIYKMNVWSELISVQWTEI